MLKKSESLHLYKYWLSYKKNFINITKNRTELNKRKEIKLCMNEKSFNLSFPLIPIPKSHFFIIIKLKNFRSRFLTILKWLLWDFHCFLPSFCCRSLKAIKICWKWKNIRIYIHQSRSINYCIIVWIKTRGLLNVYREKWKKEMIYSQLCGWK